MQFTTYGNRNNPAVLLMHGMCQDWHSMYEFLHDLETVYYLIVPEGYGHGQMMYFQGNELSKMIIKEGEAKQ